MGFPKTLDQEFFDSDPVHGHVMRTVEKVGYCGYAGGAVGAFALASVVCARALSKRPTAVSVLSRAVICGAGICGAGICGAVGGFGMVVDVGSKWYQLNSMETAKATAKYHEWLQKRES